MFKKIISFFIKWYHGLPLVTEKDFQFTNAKEKFYKYKWTGYLYFEFRNKTYASKAIEIGHLDRQRIFIYDKNFKSKRKKIREVRIFEKYSWDSGQFVFYIGKITNIKHDENGYFELNKEDFYNVK